MGKVKFHIHRFLSYAAPQRLWHAAFLVASACVSACASNQDSTYAGKLTPIAGTCDASNRATLSRHAETVQFTPQEGVIVLEGTLSPTGLINASLQTTGMDRQPYRLTFTGQLTGATIQGTYVTPRCRYAVSMQAAPR